MNGPVPISRYVATDVVASVEAFTRASQKLLQLDAMFIDARVHKAAGDNFIAQLCEDMADVREKLASIAYRLATVQVAVKRHEAMDRLGR